MTQEKGTHSLIPSPHINSLKCIFRQHLLGYKTTKRATRQNAISVLCILNLIYQHKIISSSPECRKITKVCTQLTTGMRSCEIAQIGSQGQIVFGIKNT